MGLRHVHPERTAAGVAPAPARKIGIVKPAWLLTPWCASVTATFVFGQASRIGRLLQGVNIMKSPICDMLRVEFPLLAFSHCRDVVAAVSRAGGFGVLGATTHSPESIEQELRWIDDHVDGKTSPGKVSRRGFRRHIASSPATF
jgi:hypothetical protein